MQKDCILILGAGLTASGELTAIGKSRVEKGLDCYKKALASRILLCGGNHARLQIKPPKTEAQAMFDYLIQEGISIQHLYKEENSQETLGNAFFAKKFLEKQGWKNIIIITSNFHVARTQYLFKKVFGATEYNIEIIPSLTFLSPEEILQRIESEAEKIQESKRQLSHIENGDSKAIQEIISQLPQYKKL
ncbi:YdcF family protein [Candidatus Woesearchaeota archaeon]|nr:YdcF family protein [Candidatus Woesearchaeota archaeon]